MRTLPDGLWLGFGGKAADIFVDIFVIEACSSIANLLDKRARFAPSTHSLVAVCPVPWLLGPVGEGDATPRWRAIGLLRAAPVQPLIVPVRDCRVLYGLKQRHFRGFTDGQIAHPHEYFAPMEALIEAESASNPALRALVARATPAGHVMVTARA